jgi:hypothetical protein
MACGQAEPTRDPASYFDRLGGTSKIGGLIGHQSFLCKYKKKTGILFGSP